MQAAGPLGDTVYDVEFVEALSLLPHLRAKLERSAASLAVPDSNFENRRQVTEPDADPIFVYIGVGGNSPL